jgi:hypothetical protein
MDPKPCPQCQSLKTQSNRGHTIFCAECKTATTRHGNSYEIKLDPTLLNQLIKTRLGNIDMKELAVAIDRLRVWQLDPRGEAFTSQLYRLFSKADHENYAKLADAFPVHAVAHEMWYNSSPPEKLFEEWKRLL